MHKKETRNDEVLMSILVCCPLGNGLRSEQEGPAAAGLGLASRFPLDIGLYYL